MKYAHAFQLGTREIGLDQPTYFIADIAANHDGDLERAKELIYLAKDAGADCAKFQHFLAKDIVSDYGFKALRSQQSHQASWKKSIFEVYEQYHCRREWTETLINTCDDAGIDFMTTPYDFAAIDLFADKIPGYKIGSGDITWVDAVERIAQKGKPVMLASGASSMADTERAVAAILKHTPDIALMQCNTNYTADLENFKYINLNVLKTFAIRWPGMVLGLSDHTLGSATVLGAIALGARVIEKHFTDDNEREGPDHHFAMNPITWRDMVERSRELELALGTGIKTVEDNEQETVVIQRRALRVKADLENGIQAGEIITKAHLESLRPCPADALPPYELPNIIGRKAAQALTPGVHLRWSDLTS